MSNTDNKDKLHKHFDELLGNETRYGLVMAIKNFGSLNIKTLARLLGKAESTIFHHITELLKEPKIIEIDTEKTEKTRGKYFKLSNNALSSKRFVVDDTPFEQQIPEILEKYLALEPEELRKSMLEMVKKEDNDYYTIADNARKSLAYHHTIERFIINEIENTTKFFKKKLIPKQNIPFPTVTNLSMNIKVSSLHHTLLIAKLTIEYFRNLANLKKEIEEEIKLNKISEESIITEYIHVFGGEFGEFEFSKE